MTYLIPDDLISFGPHKGKRFKSLSSYSSTYFFACMEYLPEVTFEPFTLCIMIIKGDYDLDTAFRMYQKNIVKSRDSFKGLLEISASQKEIEKKIIENLRAESYNAELHKTLVKEFDALEKKPSTSGRVEISDNWRRRHKLISDINTNLAKWSITQILKDGAHRGVKSEIELKMKAGLRNPEDAVLKIDIVEDKYLFEIILDYSTLYEKSFDERNKSNFKYDFENDKVLNWSCDICGGDDTTGCLIGSDRECARLD